MKKDELVEFGKKLEKLGRIKVSEDGFVVDICDDRIDNFYTTLNRSYIQMNTNIMNHYRFQKLKIVK